MSNYNSDKINLKSKSGPPEFAHYIAGLTNAKIIGVFLERNADELVMVMKNVGKFPDLHNPKPNKFADKQCCEKCAGNSAADARRRSRTDDPFAREPNVRAAGLVEEEVIIESRFSDLIILDAQMSFDAKQKAVLSDFTNAVLTRGECPVMIAPYAFHSIEEIIFAYDGSSSAMYAIKQFYHLFPSLSDKKLTVLQVNSSGDEPVKHRDEVRSLLQLNYSNIQFDTIMGDARNELYNYLMHKQEAVIVMGAFGKKHFPGLDKSSTAQLLVKTINLPLFIAHH